MSRLGRKAVSVPANVKVSIKDRTVSVQGPGGTLSYTFTPEVSVKWDETEKALKCSIDPKDEENNEVRACWGSTRSHLQNMVQGVTKGYEQNMEVIGVGWTATVQGDKLKLVVGYANPILLPIPKGVTVTVDKAQDNKTPVKIKGSDKQSVGQFASSMRAVRKPEPYNGKGIKYATEVIKKKQGKTFGA